MGLQRVSNTEQLTLSLLPTTGTLLLLKNRVQRWPVEERWKRGVQSCAHEMGAENHVCSRQHGDVSDRSD